MEERRWYWSIYATFSGCFAKSVGGLRREKRCAADEGVVVFGGERRNISMTWMLQLSAGSEFKPMEVVRVMGDKLWKRDAARVAVLLQRITQDK